MIKYKTWFDDTIIPVDVVRETESSVWVVHGQKERRHAKQGEYENYFNTWEQAQAHLIKNAEDKLTQARRSLERAQGLLGNVKGMKNPQEATK